VFVDFYSAGGQGNYFEIAGGWEVNFLLLVHNLRANRHLPIDNRGCFFNLLDNFGGTRQGESGGLLLESQRIVW
jgi:hypothetical protein